jgi:hypothetical protein
MFKTLTDTSKAAIFTALVLILAVAAALAINAWDWPRTSSWAQSGRSHRSWPP